MDKHSGHSHHYILPDGKAIKTWLILLVFTVITVLVAKVNLGPLNFTVALLVATIKALLVALIFMNLSKDAPSNGLIFGTAFIFLAIFLGLSAPDLFFRGDVYLKYTKSGPEDFLKPVKGKSQFKRAWEPRPELVAHGKTLFATNCTSCHGNEGRGDGPAAASLTPKPRNFHENVGWKNGRKPSQIFKTLREGLPGSAMASFATLPSEDRWALAHYVASLGPSQEKDSNEDLVKVGVNPASDGEGEAEAKLIPIESAMRMLVKEGGTDGKKGNLSEPQPSLQHYNERLGRTL